MGIVGLDWTTNEIETKAEKKIGELGFGVASGGNERESIFDD